MSTSIAVQVALLDVTKAAFEQTATGPIGAFPKDTVTPNSYVFERCASPRLSLHTLRFHSSGR